MKYELESKTVISGICLVAGGVISNPILLLAGAIGVCWIKLDDWINKQQPIHVTYTSDDDTKAQIETLKAKVEQLQMEVSLKR